jgi:hypothetical protein
MDNIIMSSSASDGAEGVHIDSIHIDEMAHHHNNGGNSLVDVFVDVIQLESNSPGEDRFCVYERPYGAGIDRAFGVVDGHGGYLAADMTGIVCRFCASCSWDTRNMIVLWPCYTL